MFKKPKGLTQLLDKGRQNKTNYPRGYFYGGKILRKSLQNKREIQ